MDRTTTTTTAADASGAADAYPDYSRQPTETEARAQRLGLPRIIWTEPSGTYRIVLVYDGENDRIERVAERAAGWDALGVQRWELLAPAAWDEACGAAHAPRDWYHLGRALMADAAPWPAEEA